MSRRVLAVIVFAMVVLAACASDDGEVIDLDGSSGAAGAPDDSAPGGGTPATGGPTSADTAPPGTEAPTPTSGQASQPPAATSSTAQRDTRPPPDQGGVGAFAPFYLRPAESAAIVLDVHAQEGAAPRQATVDHLRAVVSQVSGKQVTTTLGAIGGGSQAWTSDQIRALGDEHGPGQSRQQAVLKLFYLRGEFAESDTVLGVAVRSDVAAVFSDKVDEAAGVLGNSAAIEDAVSLHEVGHILGLVDLFLDTGREDPEHPGHSPNRDSVMYYAVESTLIGSLLEGGPPRDFDQADLDDLAAIRNG